MFRFETDVSEARLRSVAWRPRPGPHAQGLCARTYVSGKWGEGKEGGKVTKDA